MLMLPLICCVYNSKVKQQIIYIYAHTRAHILGRIRPLCLISKIKNLMREGGKKHLRKKNIGHISGKVNEGDKIKKKLLTYFKKSL